MRGNQAAQKKRGDQMKTYQTETAAKEAIKALDAEHIIKIDHESQGTVYICCKCPLSILQSALDNKPMPEINSLISEVSLREPVITRQPAKREFGWCNKCQSYCYGDCQA